MIGPHWSKGWVIEDCEVYGSRCCGISLGKYLDPENDMYFTKKWVKSPTQMERDAVCRGQFHGWTKERIGSHTVRRCHIHHCEQTGIVGRMGAVFSTIEDNHIHDICTSSQLRGAETAGIKLHAGIDVTIRRNIFLLVMITCLLNARRAVLLQVSGAAPCEWPASCRLLLPER